MEMGWASANTAISDHAGDMGAGGPANTSSEAGRAIYVIAYSSRRQCPPRAPVSNSEQTSRAGTNVRPTGCAFDHGSNSRAQPTATLQQCTQRVHDFAGKNYV